MNVINHSTIKVSTNINAPIHKVWEIWTSPTHITQWNTASPDWHTPQAENDLRVDGKLKYRMEAKDGSMGFDFEGVYTEVKPHHYLAYTILDGRKVEVKFTETENGTEVVEHFEAEQTHSIEMQQMGWQAILDNFRTYTESLV